MVKHPGFDVYHSDRMKELRANLKKEVNWKLLKVTNEKDQNMIQQLIMMIFFHSFANYFVHSKQH
jgi:protein tyrosine/serine phosphatase